jgi:small-conductance mechanosensitive channel
MQNPWTDPSKPATTVIASMNDSSVDFKLCVWVDAAKKNAVISDMLRCVYETLGENGIEIPFPQRDITIKNAAELVARNEK